MPEILEVCIVAIEYGAQMIDRQLTPEQRGKLTVAMYSLMERRARMHAAGDQPAGMANWMAGKEIAKDLAEVMRLLDDDGSK